MMQIIIVRNTGLLCMGAGALEILTEEEIESLFEIGKKVKGEAEQ